MQLKHNIFRKESLANYLKVDSQFEKRWALKTS